MEVAIVALARPLLPGRIDVAAIETSAFFRIAQDVVSGSDLLELLFGLAIPGIEVGVQLFCELPISRANLLL